MTHIQNFSRQVPHSNLKEYYPKLPLMLYTINHYFLELISYHYFHFILIRKLNSLVSKLQFNQLWIIKIHQYILFIQESVLTTCSNYPIIVIYCSLHFALLVRSYHLIYQVLMYYRIFYGLKIQFLHLGR